MTISVELLKRWRKEALKSFDPTVYEGTEFTGRALLFSQARERILLMTQELMDQQLLEEGEES